MTIDPEKMLQTGANIKQNGSNTNMTLNNFLVILVLYLFLPTSDVYTDLAQICVFASGSYEPYQIIFIDENSEAQNNTNRLQNLTFPDLGAFNESAFAIQLVKFNDTHIKATLICESVVSPWFALLTSVPLILHLCFLLHYWWKIEDTRQKRLSTLPILIMQCWPQYQILKLLFEKSDGWKKQLNTFENTIGSIGIVYHFFQLCHISKVLQG